MAWKRFSPAAVKIHGNRLVLSHQQSGAQAVTERWTAQYRAAILKSNSSGILPAVCERCPIEMNRKAQIVGSLRMYIDHETSHFLCSRQCKGSRFGRHAQMKEH